MKDNNPVNPFVGYSSAVVHSLLSQGSKRHLMSNMFNSPAVKLLLKNDLLTQNGNVYRVYDRFFSEWLAKVY